MKKLGNHFSVTNQATDRSINQSIIINHPSINYPSINQSINQQSINHRSINQLSINQSSSNQSITNASINKSINRTWAKFLWVRTRCTPRHRARFSRSTWRSCCLKNLTMDASAHLGHNGVKMQWRSWIVFQFAVLCPWSSLYVWFFP